MIKSAEIQRPYPLGHGGRYNVLVNIDLNQYNLLKAIRVLGPNFLTAEIILTFHDDRLSKRLRDIY